MTGVTTRQMTPLLLLGCLLLAEDGLLPRQAFATEREPEEAAEAIAALEDQDFDSAQQWIDQALGENPAAPGPRAMRQWMAMLRDPDGFIASARLPGSQGDDISAPGVFEDLWHATFALYRERNLYRGDREEDAAAFIARVEQRASGVLDRLEDLDGVSDLAPWQALLEELVLAFLHQPRSRNPETFWEALEAPEPWGAWLHLLAIDYGLVPDHLAIHWLITKEESPGDTPESLLPHCLLTLMRFALPYATYEEMLSIFEQFSAKFPEGRYRDDYDLEWGRALARSRMRERRLAAVARLRPLAEGPWRNTTLEATRKLGTVLRRLGRHDEAAELFETFRKRFPDRPDQFWRETGRIDYFKKRYELAADAFRRSAEGPRGRGRDYLFMVKAMRFLPEVDPERFDRNAMREEAMKLADFASDAQCREKRVQGWIFETPGQVVELRCRLVELDVLSRHALLFPLTFLSMALGTFLEMLAVAMGLVAFVSYPRLARQTWKGVAVVTGVALVPSIPVLATGLSGAGDLAIHGAWLLQAGARIFFILAGTVTLSPAVRTQGLATLRGLLRSLRRGDAPRWLLRSWPLLAGAAVLAAIAFATTVTAPVPSPYLERFPALVSVAELGAAPAHGSGAGAFLLGMFSVVRQEILARGLLLTILAFLFRAHRHGRLVAIVAGACLFTLVVSGTMEPTWVHVGACLLQGLVLGALRFRCGVDGAVLAHLAAYLISGGSP